MISYQQDGIVITDDNNPSREPLILPLTSTAEEIENALAAYLPPPPPAPDWLGFVRWLYVQPAMMAAITTARASTGPQGEPATTALPVALEVARNEANYAAFALLWGQFLSASGLPGQALEQIVAKANEAQLPAQFVATLSPLQNEPL
ncbi:MAG: hypothetical protein FJ083_13915 [Cyanobacteria bacterium K_Offshore_surface_m2_239]|nr:hypothetical protein [Cyanobacteria bacterium K_Offshore_surface_m2_239]